MTVHFMSRKDFIDNIDTFADQAIISINDTIEESLEIKNLLGVAGYNAPSLILTFKDVDEYEDGCISDHQGNRIFKFVQEHDGFDFIVHCFAGVSRSAAVAKFIDEYYDLKMPALSSYSIFNKIVYNKINDNCGTLRQYYKSLM